MSSIDYPSLGFKCGIEIHQQLDTAKLFCGCPSLIRDDAPHKSVFRRMRAVAGEMGEFDPAALHEFLRGRTLVYEAYDDTTCLVELDEEPPHELNRKALETTLEVALLLGARPAKEVHVMRKTVIDGSNTSGFQRTMLIAEDGTLETSRGPIAIPTFCLEEDAARIISEKDGQVHYRLDRLGIPLIELATDPDIVDADHAREVAEKIGSVLRASKVKRGLGTIRQDINVSIRDGARVEVKGVQDLRLIKKLVEGEVERQLMLIKVRDGLDARGVKAGGYDVDASDVTGLFTQSRSDVIRESLGKGGKVLAASLPGLDGLLKGLLGPQLAQYARALAGVRGIFHGDELPAYGISPDEVESVKKNMGIAGDDSFFMVTGDVEIAKKAAAAVLQRCKVALDGVPVETRRAKEDGSTDFMRPLPGSSRMYPETDEPLVIVTEAMLSEIRSGLPELREDRAKRYEKLGLGKELAGQLSVSGIAELFEMLVQEHPKVEAKTVATLLTAIPKEAARRHGADIERLEEAHYRQMLKLLSEGRISKNVLPELLAGICEKPQAGVEKLADDSSLLNMGDEDLAKAVADAIKKNPGLPYGTLIGKVMAATGGRADPKAVAELIKKSL